MELEMSTEPRITLLILGVARNCYPYYILTIYQLIENKKETL